MFSLSTQANQNLRQAHSQSIKATVQTMYTIDTAAMKLNMETSIRKARLSRAQLSSAYSILTEIPTMVSEETYTTSLKELSDSARKAAWRYRAFDIRIVLLQTILTNKKKLSYLVMSTLENLLSSILDTGKNEVTLSQLVHGMKLTATTYTDRLGNIHPITEWGIDELRLQLINEMAELDLIDMRVSHKTHMLAIPDNFSSLVTKEEWIDLSRSAKYLQRKTILLEPAPIDDNMISRSSWWYNTPTLSPDMQSFITTMHSLKWEFVPNAEELVEDAFKQHLDVSTLPKWAKDRVAEYRYQIRASHANGGHYIAGKFDSALRWYWQAEIGHTQTSEALRHLVKPSGMSNVVKYDMSNNVVQMYAVALHDRELAKYVSLVPTEDTVEDLRLQLAKYLNKHLEVDTFDRNNIKPLFMIWAYNGGKARLLDGIFTDETNFFTGHTERTLKSLGLRAIVELSGKSIGDDTIWNTFTGILNKLVPSIVELKKVMARIVKSNPFTESEWTLADGGIAQYASVVTSDKELHWVSSDGKTRQHTHHRKELEANAKAAGLLPRSIHSLDAYLMRQLVIRAATLDIVIVPNHDSFMFDECHTDTVFDIARTLFVEIMEENHFYSIVKQLNKTGIKEVGEYVERDTLTPQDIMQSFPMKAEEL